MDQAITNPISGPSFDFTFTIGPELDNLICFRLHTHLHLVMTHSEPPAQENEAFDLADLMKNCLHFKQTVEYP